MDLVGLARACHPGPTLAVTLLATGYGVAVDLPPGRLLLVAAAVLAGQLTIGWLNDLLDAERDRRVGRTDKPLATGDLAPGTVRIALGVALAAAVVLSLACGLAAAAWHGLVVASGWAYDLGVKATAWSWLPFALAFGALPVFVASAGDGVPPWWTPLAGALLGVGAHLVNVVPDLADDERTGVRGLGHRLGARGASTAAVVALSAATLVVVAGAAGVPAAVRATAVVLVAGLAGLALARGGRTAFRLAVVIAAVDVVLVGLAA